MISDILNSWLNTSNQLDDEDGIFPPHREIIECAIKLFSILERINLTPDSVSADPNGGIVFEYDREDYSESIHIWDDGIIEHFVFRNCELVSRLVLNDLIGDK